MCYTNVMGRKNWLYLGPNPCEEECVNMDDYSGHRAEVRRYVEICILEAAILAKDGFNFVSAYPLVPLGVAPVLECVHPPLNTNLKAASKSLGSLRLNL